MSKRKGGYEDFLAQTHRHFVNLSKRAQHEQVIQLKNKLRAAHDADNQFYSDSYLTEQGTSWFSFQIQGNDKRTIFNVMLGCCANDYWGKVDSAAFDEVYELLSDNERAKEFDIKTKAVRRNGKIVYYETIEKEAVSYPQFGGMTYQEYSDKVKQSIHESGDIIVSESISFDPRSEGGLFISATLNKPILYKADIIEFIDSFLSNDILMARIEETKLGHKEVLLLEEVPLTVQSIAFGDLSRHGNSLALKFKF